MLPKQYRISSSQMRLVLRRGKIIRGDGLRVTSIVLPEATGTKIGFVVSSRIEKTAVGRHKLKRMLREAAMLVIDRFEHSSGYVIAVEKHIEDASTSTIGTTLQKLV